MRQQRQENYREFQISMPLFQNARREQNEFKIEDLSSFGQRIATTNKLNQMETIMITHDLVLNDQPTQDITCPICHNIFINPVACNYCLNHFCCDCLMNHFNFHLKCPLCKRMKDIRKPVPILLKQLSRLLLRCRHNDDGCVEQINYDNYQKHVHDCNFQKEQCPNEGCEHVTIKQLMQEHTQNECQYRMAECANCQHLFRLKSLSTHVLECPMRKIQCSKCEIEIVFQEESEHLAVCERNLEKCEFCFNQIQVSRFNAHSGECLQRKIQCVGCAQMMIYGEFMEHSKTCQDFPEICPNCKEIIKRKDLQNHTLQDCIQYIKKYFQNEINLLKKKNNDLVQLITQDQQQGCVRFSVTNKDDDIFVFDNYKSAVVRERKQKKRDRFVMLDVASLNDTFEWIFLIKSLTSDWFAIGVADLSCIYSNRRFQELGHNSYLVSANGVTYSSDNANQNSDQAVFKMETGDKIICQFILKPKQIRIFNETKNQECHLDIQSDLQLYPCVCLRTAGDCIQIL